MKSQDCDITEQEESAEQTTKVAKKVTNSQNTLQYLICL